MRRLLLSALFLPLLACTGSLPPAPPHAYVAPEPRSPPMQICWVEYARDDVPGSYALAGESARAHWAITYSGLLVRHPAGDLLIDAGHSSHFAEEIKTVDFFPRLLLLAGPGGARILQSAPAALRAVGEDPARLRGLVLSHIHTDHSGGLVDLPGVPVLLSQEELDFARRERYTGSFDVVYAEIAALEPRARPVRFTATPYENFDRSLDYFGDGSVVFVPLPGHTPGSMGTFVNLSRGQRFFHVGDATDSAEAIDKRRGKSVMLEATDHDGALADATVSGLAQLRTQDAGLFFLPAHDRAAWEAAFGRPGGCLGTAPAGGAR
jgi:N-acyl homoserine lactone hydrolase